MRRFLYLYLVGTNCNVCIVFNLRILYRCFLAVSTFERIILFDYFFFLSSIRAMATMRSKYVPEEGLFSSFQLILVTIMFVVVRATVMNYFRIPLNLIVVVILLKVRHEYRSMIMKFVFVFLQGFSIEIYLHGLCCISDHRWSLYESVIQVTKQVEYLRSILNWFSSF